MCGVGSDRWKRCEVAEVIGDLVSQSTPVAGDFSTPSQLTCGVREDGVALYPRPCDARSFDYSIQASF